MLLTKKHQIAMAVIFLSLFFFIGQAHRFSLLASKSCQPTGFVNPGIVTTVEGWLGYAPTIVHTGCTDPTVDGVKALQMVIVLSALILIIYSVVATIVRAILIKRGVIKGNIIK